MSSIASIAVLLIIVIFPIKFAAQFFQAEKTGLGSCIIAIFLGLFFSSIAAEIHPLGQHLSIFLVAFSYSLVLGTTYLKGLGIALIQMIIIIVAGVIAVELGYSGDSDGILTIKVFE